MANARKLKVPVRFVDGHWELEYGGDVPVVNGTRGTLEVSEAAITDADFREALTRAEILHVLDEGTDLLFLLNVRDAGREAPTSLLRRPPPGFFSGDEYVGPDARVVKVRLGPLAKLQVRQPTGFRRVRRGSVP